MSSAIKNEPPLLPRIVETLDISRPRSLESSPKASPSLASDQSNIQKHPEAALEESQLKTLLELSLPPLLSADDAADGGATVAVSGETPSRVLCVGLARSKCSRSRSSSLARLPKPPAQPVFPEDTRNLFVLIRTSGEFL